MEWSYTGLNAMQNGSLTKTNSHMSNPLQTLNGTVQFETITVHPAIVHRVYPPQTFAYTYIMDNNDSWVTVRHTYITVIHGPDNWAKLYTAACGSRQSPIDIETGCLTPHSAHTGQRLTWRYSASELITLKNTGHGWQINADDSMSEVSGGPLNCDYELSQVHCHWGEEDAEGSEHTVNGKHYPGELHLVHWNKTNYCSAEEATKHPDGLCVFAVFLKVGNTNHELQKLVEKIPEIIHKGESTNLSAPLNIKNILPKNHAYWSYMGSLTTPPCLECVIWIIFSEAIEVSHEQLEAFRTLRSHPQEMCKDMNCCDGQLKHNYRPTAPRGERVIVASDS